MQEKTSLHPITIGGAWFSFPEGGTAVSSNTHWPGAIRFYNPDRRCDSESIVLTYRNLMSMSRH